MIDIPIRIFRRPQIQKHVYDKCLTFLPRVGKLVQMLLVKLLYFV
jgi:hypothetical protein